MAILEGHKDLTKQQIAICVEMEERIHKRIYDRIFDNSPMEDRVSASMVRGIIGEVNRMSETVAKLRKYLSNDLLPGGTRDKESILSLGRDLGELRGDLGELRGDLGELRAEIKALRENPEEILKIAINNFKLED